MPDCTGVGVGARQTQRCSAGWRTHLELHAVDIAEEERPLLTELLNLTDLCVDREEPTSYQLQRRRPLRSSPMTTPDPKPKSAPHPIGHVHRAATEAPLVDELKLQTQIGREGRLAGA